VVVLGGGGLCGGGGGWGGVLLVVGVGGVEGNQRKPQGRGDPDNTGKGFGGWVGGTTNKDPEPKGAKPHQRDPPKPKARHPLPTTPQKTPPKGPRPPTPPPKRPPPRYPPPPTLKTPPPQIVCGEVGWLRLLFWGFPHCVSCWGGCGVGWVDGRTPGGKTRHGGPGRPTPPRPPTPPPAGWYFLWFGGKGRTSRQEPSRLFFL